MKDVNPLTRGKIVNKGSAGVPGNLELRGKITKKMVQAYHFKNSKKSLRA